MIDLSRSRRFAPIYTPAPLNRQAPLNRGLVAWYKVLPHLSGGRQWFDIAGLNPATLTNMSSGSGWGGSPAPGGFGSLRFDGTDDYVQTPGTPFSFERTQPFSVSLWANFAAANNEHCLIGNLSAGAGTYQGWELHKETSVVSGHVNQINAFLINSFPSNAIQQHWTFAPTVSTWYHLLWTYDGSSTAAGNNLYVNGAPQTRAATAIDTLSASIVSAQSVRIGARTNATVQFSGSQDSLKIYSRALSAADAYALYTDERLGCPSTLNRLAGMTAAQRLARIAARNYLLRLNSIRAA